MRFKKLNIETYEPGKSSLKRFHKVIKLSANESALGVSSKAKKILSNKNLSFFRYPDGKSSALRKQISKKFKCNEDRIICGAGSDEVIQMLCQLFLNPKDEVILPQYSFLMYRIYAKIVGAKVIFAKENNFKVSIPEIIKNVSKKTKIVFLANPNNPTGTYLTSSELLELRKKLRKNILLVVDDAYAEYMKNNDYKSGLKLFKNKQNVFILRTFSKIYGLSSLRVGWGYGSKKIIKALYVIKPPFNVNEVAQKVEARLIPLLQAKDSPYSRFIMRVPGFGSSANSYNSFIIIALLDDWKNRKKGQQVVLREAIGKIVTLPQALAFPISPQSIRVSNYNKPVQMVIYGSTYEELEEIQKKVIRKLRSNKSLSRIESDYNRNKPEVKLVINKNKAKDLGVSTKAIGETLETLYGGKKITTFNKLGKEYPILVQQYLSDRRNKEGVSKIFVRSETNGKLISLSNLVSFKEEGSAKQLARYNRQRAVTISANINEGYTLTEAIKFFENIMADIAPKNQITWKGKSEEIKETSNELFIIFALALLTAYLVMAATFNSFIHPFIIVLTVPLAIFGGLVFILFLNSSVNIFSQIALIILIGISTKNSILIVDYVNRIRTTGKSIEIAVKEACAVRFRPIIMTSLSTMIAMIPLVIGNIGPGAGEGSRLAVGATILGGMIISTFFTLYVTPSMYLALAKNTKRIDVIDLELKKELSKK